MFERYVGRKVAPKVRIESPESSDSTSKALVEKVMKNPDFIKWFSGSVVADSSGSPIMVFHGTRGSHDFGEVYRAKNVSELGVHFGTAQAASARFIDTFDTAMVLVDSGKSHEMARERIQNSTYLSDAEKEEELRVLDQELKEVQEEHARRKETKLLGGEKIYPVFLRIVNPVRVADPGTFSEENLKRIQKDLVQNFVPRGQVSKITSTRTIEELRKALVELGYDGVVYKNMVEGVPADSYIPIVGPEQIRSAFDS